MRMMPDMNGEGKRVMYPKMLIDGVVDTSDLVEALKGRSTFSAADIKGLLAGLADYIAEQTARGMSVRIEELGTFSAALALKADKEREVEGGRRYKGPSVELRTIRFRPSRALLTAGRKSCRLTRCGEVKKKLLLETEAERLAAALDFIGREGVLRLADFVELTGLGRTRASLELRKWQDEGALVARGRASHKVYVKP